MNQVVLLVDDNSKVRMLLKSTLESFGLSVIEAVDGLDGLKKASENEVDYFLIDYKMPIMDGITLIKNLRDEQKYKQSLICLMTTEHSEDLSFEAAQLGIEHVLEKPLNTSVLKGILQINTVKNIA